MPHNNDADIFSMDALHRAFGKVAIVGVLVGDYAGVDALRLARKVFEKQPDLFPDFAREVVEAGARSAAWSLSCLVKDRVGAWEVYEEARDIARGASISAAAGSP